ncbi:hypothetical protein PFTANZ_06366 [Plasmodium falciparum Tanzania (2000708)]|uniref:Duffy-binding-like domain-containing protein n=1 Tax=Plasmodium falciparum Tanzania (2000708) TaxID=1036725 RepID=A0A024VXH0_PLAFA|nr:hypothetical protein PFTANZ_06366 [Plasmodium falciparum Tanzania (2000708)]
MVTQSGGGAGSSGAGIDKCTEVANGKHNTKIDKLLQHELNEAKQCIEKQEECEKKPPKPKPPPASDVARSGPSPLPALGNTSDANATYPVVAQTVAHQMHETAKTQLRNRGGRNALRADATKGEYSKNRKPQELSNICNITLEHSNDSRHGTDKYKGPCTGKNPRRFEIGTQWKGGEQVNKTYKDVYLPPRREHMCTSNLEYLQTTNKPLNGSDNDPKLVNNSFLGDVLLSAKFEADFIKQKYNEQPGYGDNETMCRAMKYSFADLGDIIKGTDLWDLNEGENKTQGHLEKIFEKIKEHHPGIKGNTKYPDDKDKKPPYKLLREDWWTANRRQVWKAMQCALKDLKKFDGDCAYSRSGIIPYDDYIPQRLRWMTEWAEWFCKAQSQEYENLVASCKGWKNNGDGKDCTQKDKEYTPCAEACEAYKTKIDTWKTQWNKIKEKYEELYEQARTVPDRTGFNDGSPDYQQVVDFFKVLQKQNSGKTTYDTAAGYIHQEARVGDCDEQNEFCEKENGVGEVQEGAKENKKYAFKHPPHGYDLACTCNTRDQQTDGRAPSDGDVRSADPRPAATGPTGNDADEEDDDDDDEDDSPKKRGTRTNPCYSDTTTKYAVLAEKVAADIHKKSHTDMLQRSGKNGDSVLKGDISKAIFKDGASPNEVNNVCQITEKHSNAHDSSKDPCNGKDGGQDGDRMKIGTIWQTKDDLQITDPHLFFPPRRQHMCTSNLEKLDYSWVINNGNGHVNDTGVTTTGNDGAHGKSGDKGSICVPPRRRRLYIQKLHEWANIAVSQGTTSALTPSRAQDPLLAAFVESAAIETFFLWHKYKMDKAREKKEKNRADGIYISSSNDDNGPQKELESGKIPDEFLRQMFYTLGDYRDICVGKTPDGIDTVSASGDNKSGDTKIKDISEKIEAILKNGDKKPGQTRESWWEKNVESIWNGMIYALTYDTNTASGQTPEQDKGLKQALMAKLEKETGKEGEYHYENVKLENSGTGGPKPGSSTTSQTTQSSSTSDNTLNNPKLTEFVEITPYFRYLEEWGQNFCKKRTEMLGKIKEDCYKDDGSKKQYSGFGEDCDDQLDADPTNFKDLGYSCPKSCRSYKKWIERKGKEFEEQKNAYDGQKDKCVNGNNKGGGDNGFCGTVTTNKTAAGFLKTLASCKKDSGEDNNKIFDDNGDTFKHTNLCDPCSEFKVKCNGDGCRGGANGNKCPGGKISPKNIDEKTDGNGNIEMLVSDNSGNEFNGLEACQDKCIFEEDYN